MDLFTPLVAPERLHPNLRTVNAMTHGRNFEREELQRWLEGFPDRDGKFVQEFQTTFNSSFWEIYLYAAFKAYGSNFDWAHPAPDFNLTLHNVRFTVEATTANAAVDSTPEWDRPLAPPDLQNIDFNELNRVAIIRLANAFVSKSGQFEEKYSKLPHVIGKPFVLAIAPFEQPWFNLQVFRAIEALLFDFYVDEEEYLAAPERYPNGPQPKSLGSVEKDNGAEIELGFFDCERFAYISAVIFSSTATWGKINALAGNPDTRIASTWSTANGEVFMREDRGDTPFETVTDGLRIYHNPYAQHPLPVEVLRRNRVVQVTADPIARRLLAEQTDCALLTRQAFTSLPHPTLQPSPRE